MRRYVLAALLVACAPAAVAPTTRPTPAPTAAPTQARSATPTPTVVPTAAASPTFSTRTPRPIPSATPATLALGLDRWSDIPTTGSGRFVTSDGQMVWTEWGRYRTQRLAPSGVEALREAALASGLFTHDRQLLLSPRPGVTIPGHGLEGVAIAVRVGDRLVRVSGAPSVPDYYEPSAERDALRQLALRLTDVAWLPAGAFAESPPRDYLAAHYRLLLIPSPNTPSSTPHAAAVWPFGDPPSFGVALPSGVPGYPPLRCAVVDAADARLVAEAFVAAHVADQYDPAAVLFTSGMGWPAFNGDYQVQLTPFLPHEPLDCESARPRI